MLKVFVKLAIICDQMVVKNGVFSSNNNKVDGEHKDNPLS